MSLAAGRLELGWRLVARGRMDSLPIAHRGVEIIELIAQAKLSKLIEGDPLELASSASGALREARVSPGSYVAAAYRDSRLLDEERFTLAAGETGRVVLRAHTAHMTWIPLIQQTGTTKSTPLPSVMLSQSNLPTGWPITGTWHDLESFADLL